MELSPSLKSLMSRPPPLSLGDTFRIRPTGQSHTTGDINCPGCGALDGIRYPHPHQDKAIKHLEFLVHGEAVGGAFARFCEGGCSIPAIKFAPDVPPKEPI